MILPLILVLIFLIKYICFRENSTNIFSQNLINYITSSEGKFKDKGEKSSKSNKQNNKNKHKHK